MQRPDDDQWVEHEADIDVGDVEPEWDDAAASRRLAPAVAAWAELT